MKDRCSIKIIIVERTAKNKLYKDLVAIQVTGGAPKIIQRFSNIHQYKTNEAFKNISKELQKRYLDVCITKV